MKNSTTRLKEAPTMRSGLPLIILLLVLVIGLSACTFRKGENASDTQHKSFDSIVNAPFTSDRDKSDALLNEIVSCIEKQEEEALIDLFSPKQVSEQDMAQQCTELFSFFSGNMVSYHWNGQEEDSSKHDGEYYKAITLSYDVFTNETQYWFAMKFCTDDTKNEENIGIHSLYIVQLGDTDSEYSYWNDVNWTPGINVMTEPQA